MFVGAKGKTAPVARATLVLVPLIRRHKRANVGNERDREKKNSHVVFDWLLIKSEAERRMRLMKAAK
jgi:hypothetical protein